MVIDIVATGSPVAILYLTTLFNILFAFLTVIPGIWSPWNSLTLFQGVFIKF